MYVPPYFLPLFASSIGLSSSTGAGLIAGFGAATAIGRLTGGFLCDRLGAVNALAITTLINSLSMFAIWPFSNSLAPLFVFALINGCANGSFFVTLPTAAAKIAPGSAAASMSLMIFFWTPGYLLGAPLAGILIEATGAAEGRSIGRYMGAIFYSAGVGALATALVMVSRWRLDHKVWKKL
jgi:predicted MFS family arabinose efflux permease